MTKQKSQVCVYDFTYYSDDNVYEGPCQELIDFLNRISKKAVWQLEQGETKKKYHYQGRLSLKVKSFLHKIPSITGIHYTITSNENQNNDFYVIKENTRIEGPWKLEDFPPAIETKQLTIFKNYELRPYQSKLLNMMSIFDLRKVDLIYDNVGNIGKSLFSEYCEYINLAEEIPPFRLMEDIFQWVYGRPKKSSYICDMPRGMKKDKLGDFYAGLEVIKNGVAYDKRNYPKKCRFDRPRIFVFTNTLPNFDLMSMDRWNVWSINVDYELIPYSQDTLLISDSDCE